ncbi:MAG: flagellar filament capping protein FliD [Gammaproteobacteria bacterium]|nr:flagellar filament capping protein FliD [Gammaproteobacteria bacterium]
MASIQSLGVGSGVLTSELVDDIIAAERESTDLRLDVKRAEYEAKISAFGAIRSSLDALSNAADALGDRDSFLINTVSSTNEAAVTATSQAGATPGIHTVEVLATARAQTLTTIRFDSADQIVGEGTIDIRFGTTTFAGGNYDSFTENTERASGQIVIDSTNNTVDGIRDAINAADVGVIASVVNDGQGFILVLTSDRTGDDNSMELTVTESGAVGLGGLAFNATQNTPGTNLTQTVDADDAIVVIDGITVTRETNTIDEVIPGVTFSVAGNNAGAPATITIAEDITGIETRMQAFVDAYNSMKTLTDDLTDFNQEDKVGALLTGDATVRGVLAQLRRMMTRAVDQIESSSVRALVDLGISTDQNSDYQLAFSNSKFRNALSASSSDVVAMLAEQTRASDNQITFNRFQTGTQAGTYDVDIFQVASQGEINGATVAGLAGPITIDADNDTFEISVDGIRSEVITLAQGIYADGDALAVQLQSQINQDSNLRTANADVEVTYDSSNQQLTIQSTSYGSGSSVGIINVDTNTATTFGISAVSASSGENVAGTINGIEGIGTGQFLSIPSGSVAATAGRYVGTSIAGFDTPPVTIDATNDTFRLSVDGTLSSDIVLNAGAYLTAEDLASEIQTQINADTTLSGSGLAVTVSFDNANNRFEITSDSTGEDSSVNLTFALSGTVSDLGLTVGTGTIGRQATSVADPASGIQIQVQGEAVGERGSVTLVRGVMNQIASFLDSFVSFGGGLANKLDSLGNLVEDIEAEAADFSRRMSLLEDRMRIRFAAADALIFTLNSTSSFLEGQLDSLPGYTRKN